MVRRYCQTCEVLKELYRLKTSHFLMAAKSRGSFSKSRRPAREEDLNRLKEEALCTLRELIRHRTSCYGLTSDQAA